jgi:hypothetical protein
MEKNSLILDTTTLIDPQKSKLTAMQFKKLNGWVYLMSEFAFI